MALSSWSNTTYKDYVTASTLTWREISKTGTSGAATLFACDTSNIISVAKGTTLVCMKSLTNYLSGDNMGLTDVSNPGYGNPCPFLGTGVYSSANGKYAVIDLGYNDSSTVLSGKYAQIKAFAICTEQDTPLISKVYGALDGGADRSGNYFTGSYYKTSSNQYGWSSIHNQNHTFAAITLATTHNSSSCWQHFQYTFYSGFVYDVTLYAHCASNVCEGIVVFTNTHSDPDNTYSISYLISHYGALSYSVAGNENNGLKNFTYTPSSKTTLHFYYRTSSVSSTTTLRYGYIKIIMKQKIYIHSNANPDTVTPLSIIPYNVYDGVLVSPLSRMGQDNVPYTFLGFFASTLPGSTAVLTTAGKLPSDNKDMILLGDGSNVYNYYANWGNTISYSTVAKAYAYCTTAAEATTKTKGNVSVTIASNPIKCASGEAVTISYGGPAGRFSINNTAQYLSASNGLSSGTPWYTGTAYFSSKSGSTYFTMESSKTLPYVYFSAVTATYNDPTTPGITQISYLPVYSGSYTVTDYFSRGTDSTQTISYNNGTSRAGSVSYSWGGMISSPGMGTTYSSQDGYSKSVSGSAYLRATGEGSKTATKYITSAKFKQNLVTDINLYTPWDASTSRPDSFYFENTGASESPFLILARFTSGEEGEVVNGGTQNTNFTVSAPSSIVSVFRMSGINS